MTRSTKLLTFLLGIYFFLASCSNDSDDAKSARNPDVERGRAVFVAMKCHSCHRVFAECGW